VCAGWPFLLSADERKMDADCFAGWVWRSLFGGAGCCGFAQHDGWGEFWMSACAGMTVGVGSGCCGFAQHDDDCVNFGESVGVCAVEGVVVESNIFRLLIVLGMVHCEQAKLP